MVDDERSALEKDLEDFLVENLEYLERGLSFLEREAQTDVGIIDIVARDRRDFVIIELKAGEAGDSAIGQIMRYMAWYARCRTPNPVRGILVAYKFSAGAVLASSLVPNLKLMRILPTQFEVVT